MTLADKDYSLLVMAGTTEKELADVLLSGSASPEFLRALAWALCPPENKHPPYKLTLSRRSAHRPKGAGRKRMYEISDDMLALESRGLSRGEYKREKLLIADRYSVSARTVEQALKDRKIEDTLWEEMERRWPSPEPDGEDKSVT